jgi:ADP-heptose:LPS heptosyltransferase
MSSRIRDALLPLAATVARRPAGGDPRRVLILQPDHLGDIILSEPAVRLLRQHLPEHELVGVVGPWSEEIARLAWPVDRIVTVTFPGFERTPRRRAALNAYTRLRRASQQLATLDAAHAVILRDDAWWAAWLARLSTSGLVVTLDDPRSRKFASIAVPVTGVTHRTGQSLQIASALIERITPRTNGKMISSHWDMSPVIDLDENALELARAMRSERGIASPFIVVHAGAGADVKTWPERYWRALLEMQAPRPIVLTGTSSERAMCERMACGLEHVTSVAGETTLAGLAGLLHEAALVIGTDNGPLHLAGALGTPTVRLFGPSRAERYGPPAASSRHIVLAAGWSCSRCGDLSSSRPAGCGCMTAVQPATVLAAVQKILTDAA